MLATSEPKLGVGEQHGTRFHAHNFIPTYFGSNPDRRRDSLSQFVRLLGNEAGVE